MGKSKKRIFNKNSVKKGGTLKRCDALSTVKEHIKTKNISKETKDIIFLFGITPEELAETGVSFEELSAIKDLFI